MFFLAMVLNPHVLKKAQEELDRVVGSERLPDLSDQEDLPYIFAIIKEVHRWGCPAPIGIPKRVIEDDVYNGYFIPAGATVIENIWCVVTRGNGVFTNRSLTTRGIGQCAMMNPSIPSLTNSTRNGT